MSKTNFRGNKLCKKGNSNLFLTLGEKVSNFSPKFPSRAVSTASYVSKGWILGKKFWKNTVLWSSRTPRNFLDFMRKVFCRIINYAFYSPKWSFGRNFCLKSALHIHGYRAIIGGVFCKKFFGRVVQSESKVSRSSSFRKKTCWDIYQILNFGLWAVTSQTFAKKIMTALPKLPSTVSEIFKGEKLSHQKKFFPSVSDFELMFFGNLVKNFGRLTKLHSMCPEATFEGNNFQIKIISLHQFVILSWWFSGFWRKVSQISPRLHSTSPD